MAEQPNEVKKMDLTEKMDLSLEDIIMKESKGREGMKGKKLWRRSRFLGSTGRRGATGPRRGFFKPNAFRRPLRSNFGRQENWVSSFGAGRIARRNFWPLRRFGWENSWSRNPRAAGSSFGNNFYSAGPPPALFNPQIAKRRRFGKLANRWQFHRADGDLGDAASSRIMNTQQSDIINPGRRFEFSNADQTNESNAVGDVQMRQSFLKPQGEVFGEPSQFRSANFPPQRSQASSGFSFRRMRNLPFFPARRRNFMGYNRRRNFMMGFRRNPYSDVDDARHQLQMSNRLR